jgi:hypothetical protein
MNEHEHNHHQEKGQDHILVPHDHKPYWKRMHHTWSFWIFLFLMLACILYYIVSVDFAFAPHIRIK